MRLSCGFALAVLLVASPAFAFEPDAPKPDPQEVQSSEAESSEAESPKTESVETETAEVKEPASPAEALRIAVQTRLSEKFTATSKQKKDEKGALVAFYAAPDRKLLWVDENGLTTRAKAVIAEVQRADDYGLVASDYPLPDMTGFDAGASDATNRLAKAEIKISHAVLDYAHDARGGRLNPSRISKNLDPTLILPKPLEAIESISFRSDPAAYLRSFHPQHPQFEALRQKLIDLRSGGDAAKDEAPKVQMPNGPLLKLGVADPQIALLRTRLDVPQGETPELFDKAVAQAVKRFQVGHNTAADGVVGPGTRRLLNGPHLRNTGGQADINKILLNMERWRWLPQDLGSFHIAVNIPEFSLRVMKDDEIFHSTRVIVGKTVTQTPVFSNEMKTVVFGPYWNVPTSIKVGEIRPYVRRSGGFFGGGWNTAVFQRHGLRVKHDGREVDPASLDWNRVDIRNLHLFQPPGPRNVLGRVKFMFPNKHAVYMHDTPQKHLFSKAVRAESHGCIRVHNPDQLASIIMRQDRNWNEARTLSAFDTAYNQHNGLKQHIPVYMTYFTLWVNEDGSMKSFGDLYGHDRRMGPALFGGRTYAAADTGIVTQSIPKPRQRARSRDPLGAVFDGFN